MRCPECGSRLRYKKAGKYVKWVCTNPGCCVIWVKFKHKRGVPYSNNNEVLKIVRAATL